MLPYSFLRVVTKLFASCTMSVSPEACALFSHYTTRACTIFRSPAPFLRFMWMCLFSLHRYLYIGRSHFTKLSPESRNLHTWCGLNHEWITRVCFLKGQELCSSFTWWKRNAYVISEKTEAAFGHFHHFIRSFDSMFWTPVGRLWWTNKKKTDEHWYVWKRVVYKY